MAKHSAVAWSFGKSNRSHSQSFYNPGPGAYSLREMSTYKNKAPHWKVGTAQRSDRNKNNAPGPGNYELKTFMGKAPQYTMRPKTGTNLFVKNKDLPGPGNYNPDAQKKNDYKYTMRIRPNSAATLMNNPGPGTYNVRKVDSDLLKNNAYKFGSEKQHRETDFTYLHNPGPGNYEFDRSKVTNAAPKFSFGKDERATQGRPKTPGPGTYEAKPITGKDGPQISMSFYRPLSSVPQQSPGPGEYQPNLRNKLKSPEYRIGTAKRDVEEKEKKQKPGPGQYYPDKVGYVKSKAPQWVFGSEERGDMMSKSVMSNPGPGNYEYKKTMGVAPKYSMTGKNFYSGNRLDGPGPGQYNNERVKAVYSKEPSWRIGTSTREDQIKRVKREGLPGPGNYNIHSKALEGRKYMFGKQKKGSYRNGFTPGPGQYHIPCSVVDVPKYQTYSSGFQNEFRFI
mmetsp:Transcript_314/g.298  ORF Transcript_314/g.298 Transcript_314/m.298 type:complete len:450 (+) Transcript_314:7-1356(+)